MRLAVSPESLDRAAALLAGGRLVAFPTETVYGLGARADDARAVRAIFAAKGRPPGNPLIVHVATVEAARALAADWSDAAEALARRFWPGPLTLVVRRRADAIADEVTAFGPTVAVRVPAHPVALALLEKVRLPVAAPSANPSTRISPTTADHVVKGLGDSVDLVLDGGPTDRGIESTIVDVSVSPAVLLRHGAISLAEVAALIHVEDGGARTVSAEARARAPGAQARHYAPDAHVFLVPAEQLGAVVEAHRSRGARVGVLERYSAVPGIHPRFGAGPGAGLSVETLPAEVAGYAAGLYAALHRLEEGGAEVIVIEGVPNDGDWAAVRDRVTRAAAERTHP